jgi:hypothetical protein
MITGNPDPKNVSTSYAERQNPTLRMQMRRFTRLINVFSKKFENHVHMAALYAVWYNFVKIHMAHRRSPATAAALPIGCGAWRISPLWSRLRPGATWAVQEAVFKLRMGMPTTHYYGDGYYGDGCSSKHINV